MIRMKQGWTNARNCHIWCSCRWWSHARTICYCFLLSIFPFLSLSRSLSSFLKLLKRHNISTNMTQTHQGLNISRLNHAVCWGSVFIIFFLLALSYYVKFKLSSLRYFIHKVEYKRCSTHWQTSCKTGGYALPYKDSLRESRSSSDTSYT